jgi:hypothetical protein
MIDTSTWSQDQKARFLAALAFELTICARGTYDVGKPGVLQPEALRAFNEIQHRVTAALRDCVLGGERMPLSAVLEMLDSRAGQFDVDEAILRAERFSTSPSPE